MTISMRDIETIMEGLRGFLRALDCMAGPQYAFTASAIEMEGESKEQALRSTIASWGSDYQLTALQVVPNAQIKRILHDNLYSRLGNLDTERRDRIGFILNEYYGLLSTACDSNGAFHPLLSNELTEVGAVRGLSVSTQGFAVAIGNFVVLTLFAKYAQD